jgi:vesicle-fusing ATPase
MSEYNDGSLMVIASDDFESVIANKILLHPEDFEKLVFGKPYTNLMVIGRGTFYTQPSFKVKKGTLPLGLIHRSATGLNLNSMVKPQTLYMQSRGDNMDRSWIIDSLTMDLNIAEELETVIKVDTEAFRNHIINTYYGHFIKNGQDLMVLYNNHVFHLVISNIKSKIPNASSIFQYINYDSVISFVNRCPKITLDEETQETKVSVEAEEENVPLFNSSFNFEEMGIGGLDDQLESIIRRAFITRLIPNKLLKALGQKHVRGMLLYGAPGCGKTLIARQISKILNSHPPKIVNGPEILNKYVGQSEENIRELFIDAEKEQEIRGDNSRLHVIIFDEIDAICKQRGAGGAMGGATDNVVNQLLSKIDGIDSLNNILLIGMTNRKDMIDEALLRPGRLEVHIEITPPNKAGREQILRIHTKEMKKNNILSEDVNFEQIAELTEGFSGAKLEALVRSTASNVLFKRITISDLGPKGLGKNAMEEYFSNIIISQNDFLENIRNQFD